MLDYKDYIYAIYQEHGFSKAAQKLFVSQPWLSSVVKKVEQEIKSPLFDRTTNPISLTEAGEFYIKQVEKVIAIEDEMRRYFSALSAQSGQQLRIGSSMFFCTYVLPRLMEEFRELYPQVTLSFAEGDSQILTDKLLNNQLDFLLEVEHPQNPHIQTMLWASEEVVLAVPASFPINRELTSYCYRFDEFLRRTEPECRKPPVPLKAFKEEPFLLLRPGHDIYDRSMSLCKNAGIAPKPAMLLTQMMTAYYLVCEGQGISFLRSTIPEYVSPTDNVVFYQIDDPLAIRNIYLSYPKHGVGHIQQKLIDFMGSKALSQEYSSK